MKFGIHFLIKVENAVPGDIICFDLDKETELDYVVTNVTKTKTGRIVHQHRNHKHRSNSSSYFPGELLWKLDKSEIT